VIRGLERRARVDPDEPACRYVDPLRRLADVQRERAGEDDERLLLCGVPVAASLRAGLVPPDVAAHMSETRAVAQLGYVPRRLAGIVGTRGPLELVRTDDAKGRATHYFVP
jgi:hypothetical protein